MELTVLGKSPAMPDANGANSSYLLREEGFTLLVDCGSGVFSKLRVMAHAVDVDTVLITHLHADHTIDLLAFSHALSRSYRGHGRRPPLWAPPGSGRAFARLAGIFGSEQQISDAFALTEYEPDSSFELGPLSVSLAEVPHYVPTWACDVRSSNGRRITLGADCGANDAVVELGRETDLMVLEATEGPHAPETDSGSAGRFRGHMSAEEAGELARRAAAKRLLLTHFSDELDAVELQAAARASFGAEVELASEGACYTV